MAFFNAQGNIDINVAAATKNISSLSSTFNEAMVGMSRSAGTFSDKWSDAMYGIKDTKRIVSGILISQAFYTISNAALDASRAVLQFSKDMETSAISMEYFVKGAEKTARSLAFLREANALAARTPFATQDVLSMSKYMQAMGIAMEKTKSTLTVITDAAAATGATQQNLERIVFGLGQIQTKGRLANEEIRQLANANIPIYEILREELNLTGAQISRIGSMWVDADKATNAILTGLEKRYKGAADRISETMTGMTDTIRDNSLIISQIMLSGGYDTIIEKMRGIRDYLDELRETATNLGAAGALNKVLMDIDPTGKVGTDILNMVGNIRALGHTIGATYQAAKPTLKLLGDSFYVTSQIVIGSLRVIGDTTTMVLDKLNELGISAPAVSRAIATMFIAYKAAQALGTLGQGLSAIMYAANQARIQVWSMIPAFGSASVGAKVLTGSVLGLVGALGLGYAAWKMFNTALGGTGAALEDSLPTNYKTAYDKYLKDMEKYNELIAQYQDDYNKPFNDMEDAGGAAFDKLEDKASETAKAIRDGFIASFDEVYQVNLDNNDGLKEAFEPVDFGAGIPIPEFKFPEIRVEMPEAPKLQVDDIFATPLNTYITNPEDIGFAFWGPLAMVGLGGLGRWFSRFYTPKKPKGGGDADGTSKGSGIKATDPIAKKKEAWEINKGKLAKVEGELGVALKHLKTLTTDVAKLEYMPYIEQLVKQGEHITTTMQEIKNKTPEITEGIKAAVLDGASKLVTNEIAVQLVNKLIKIDERLNNDLAYAISENGTLDRQARSKLIKQLTDMYYSNREAIPALEETIPTKYRKSVVTIDKNTELIFTKFNEAITKLNNDTVDDFIKQISTLDKVLKDTFKEYNLAEIDIPDTLLDISRSVDKAVDYMKQEEEHANTLRQVLEDRDRLKSDRMLGNLTPAERNAIAERLATNETHLRNVEVKLNAIHGDLKTPTELLREAAKAEAKQAQVDLQFKQAFGKVNENISKLFKPLKILVDTPKVVMDKLSDGIEAVRDALIGMQPVLVNKQPDPLVVGTGDNAYTVDTLYFLRETYDTILAVTRDAISKSYDVKPITQDMYLGIVKELINRIKEGGQAAGVSPAVIDEIVDAIRYSAVRTHDNEQLKELTEMFKQTGSVDAVKKTLEKMAETTGKLNTSVISLDKALQTKVDRIITTLRSDADALKDVLLDKQAIDEYVADSRNIIDSYRAFNDKEATEYPSKLTPNEFEQVRDTIDVARRDIVAGLQEIVDAPYKLGEEFDRDFDLTNKKDLLDATGYAKDLLIDTMEEVVYGLDVAQGARYSELLIPKITQALTDKFGADSEVLKVFLDELQYNYANGFAKLVRDIGNKPVARETTTKAEIEQFKEMVEGALLDVSIKDVELYNSRTGVLPDGPEELLGTNVFRSPYMSGGDLALVLNRSRYAKAQLIAAIYGNLTGATQDKYPVEGAPRSYTESMAMARGSALEGIVLSSYQDFLKQQGKGLIKTQTYIDATHKFIAQIDAGLINLADVSGGSVDKIIPFDAKVLSGATIQLIRDIVDNTEDATEVFWKLYDVIPDIVPQLALQAKLFNTDTAFIGAYDPTGLPIPNRNDSFNLTGKTLEKYLKDFFFIAARDNSQTTEEGLRVLKDFLEHKLLIELKIPKDVLDSVPILADKFLKLQTKLLGPALYGTLNDFLVSYTPGGVPLDVLNTPKNLPSIPNNVLVKFANTAYSFESEIGELNSLVADIAKQTKSADINVRQDAYNKLSMVVDELRYTLEDMEPGKLQYIVIQDKEALMTPRDVQIALDALDEIQTQFSPNGILTTGVKSLNDLTMFINSKLGSTLDEVKGLHSSVWSAVKIAERIESLTGDTSKTVSSQLNEILIAGKVTKPVVNEWRMANIDEFTDIVDKRLADSGIDYERIVKLQVEQNKAKTEFPGAFNTTVESPDDKVLKAVTSLLQTKFSMEGTVKQLADIAMVLKQTTDVKGYDGVLAYLKTIDPEGLRKAVEELGRGGPTTLGSGFGAFGKTMQDTANVIKNAAGSFTLWTAETVKGSVFGDIASRVGKTIIDKPIDAINNTIYSTLSNAIHGAGLDVWNAEWNTAGYTKATQFGIRNPYAADVSELNPVKTHAYDFLFRNARSTATGQHMAGVEAPGLSDSSYTFQYKEPKFMTKTLNKWAAADSATKAAKISNFMSNIPIYLQMASFVTEAMRAEDNVKAYTEFAKNLSDEGIATLDLQQLLQDALEIRSGYVTLDLTNFQGLDEHGILKGLLNPTRWDPNAFSDLGQALNKQVDSLSAQEQYFIQAMRGGDTTAAKQNLIFGTSGKEDTAEMMSAINLLLNSESDLATVIKNELVDKGYGQTDSAETASDEALAYLSSVIKSFQSEYEKSIMTYMDTVMKYNPRVDSPLDASTTRLIKDLDVSGMSDKLLAQFSDKLGFVFSELEGDDSLMITQNKAMENLLGWTQRLPDSLKIDSLSADEVEVLSRMGIQINSDGTGTFMMAQNAGVTGTNRDFSVDADDIAPRILEALGRKGIDVNFSDLGSSLDLDVGAIAGDMVGALMRLPSLGAGDNFQASLSVDELDKLSSVIKFYDSGMMEIVDPQVLSGVKTLQQALDELEQSGALTGGLRQDVYDALVDVDNLFATEGAVTAETIAKFADGVRIAMDVPITWFSQEDIEALRLAGITIQAEGDQVYAVINQLTDNLTNGDVLLPLDEFNKLEEGTITALKKMGLGITANGEFVKVSMQGMLDEGITDIIAMYLDDQGLWDSIPNKIKESLEQSGIYTSDGFLVVQSQTTEGMAQLGDVYAQKWKNISDDTRKALGLLGVSMENELMTMQVVAANTPVGEDEILAKFTSLPKAVQDVLTGGDASIAAQLSDPNVRIKLRDATAAGFSDVATAVNSAMGAAATEVDTAVDNMARAITIAMIKVEEYKRAAKYMAEDTSLDKGGWFSKGEEYGKKSYSMSGASYTPIMKGSSVVGFRVIGTDGKEIRLDNITNVANAMRTAKSLGIPGAARGALINKDGLFNAGEFGKNEAIIPLEQPSVLAKVGAALAKHIPTGTYNITMAKSNLEVMLLEDILEVAKDIESKVGLGTGLNYDAYPPSSSPSYDYDYDVGQGGYEDLDNNITSINKVMNSYLSTLFGVKNSTYDYTRLLEAVTDATDLSSEKFSDMNLSSSNYLTALADMSKTTGLTVDQLLGMIDKSGNYRNMLTLLSESTGYTIDDIVKMAGQTRSTTEMLVALSDKTGISTDSLSALVTSSGSFNGMLDMLSTMTGYTTTELKVFAGATGAQSTLLSVLASATGLTTDQLYGLIGTAGISTQTISDLSYATGLSTDKIYGMIASTDGSKSALDLLAAQSDMTTEDFYNLMVSLGLSGTELDKLRSSTGISAGSLADLSAQTGLTVTELAAMGNDYEAIMGAMSQAAHGATVNILGMSDADWQQYLKNKQLAEVIYANTGIWDSRLGAANQALRDQYQIHGDNLTYMDLILANYKLMSETTTAAASISADQLAYLQHLIKNGTPGQAEWAQNQISNPKSESWNTGGGGGNGNNGNNSRNNAIANFGNGDIPVEIVNGKTVTKGLPVGTIITTADGSKYRIDKVNSDGSYVGSTIKTGSSNKDKDDSGDNKNKNKNKDKDKDKDKESSSDSEISRISREQGVDLGVAKVMADKNKELGYKKYSLGGVNDFTGPAMLHGTRAAAETIFNATDSKKLYDVVHGTPDLANKIATDIAKQMANRIPTQAQVRPLIKVYNQPNGGIQTQSTARHDATGIAPNPDEFTQRVLENVLPAVFNVMNSPTNNTQEKTPLYVNTLIADKQGLTELERRLYDIRVIDQTRR